MEKDDYFKIGYVAKAHGLKGEITMMITAEADFGQIDSFFVELRGTLVPHFIKAISNRGDKAFIKLDEVDTLDQANTLKGCSIYLAKEARPKLKRGEFYDDEVIGFEVHDEIIGILGTIKEISSNGPNRLLTLYHKTKEVLIPVNSPFIKSLNKSKKVMKVELPDGFLDI